MKNKYLVYVSVFLIVSLFSTVVALPYITTTLNAGQVSNQTAMSIVKSIFISNFNATSIGTPFANLSSQTTLVQQRRNIGVTFDDQGSVIVGSQSFLTNLTGNFSILIKAIPNGSGDGVGSFMQLGQGINLMGEYTIGYTVASSALTFSIANGTTSSGLTANGYVNLNAVNYIICGLNETERRWCSLNGNNVSATSAARVINHVKLGNDTMIGASLASGANVSSDLYGTVFTVAIVNSTLKGNQLNSFKWNDGKITSSIIDTIAAKNTVVELFDNGTMISYSGGNISVSIDGQTYTHVYQFEADINGSVALWRDGNNNTYLGNWDNGRMYRSPNNSLNTWTNVLNMSCDNSTGARMWAPNAMSRAPNGYLYAGSYVIEDDNYEEHCGHIWRSIDDGLTWSLVYNDTNASPLNPARHVHFVQADPYTGKIYAAMGDGEFRRKFLRSDDNGATWTIIKSGVSGDISWQPTAIAFTSAYRIIGEDNSPHDSYSRIWRSTDDVNWEVVYNYDPVYYGFWGWSRQDSQGRIYMGMSVVDNSSDMIVVMSEDQFNTTQIVYQKDAGTFTDLSGTVFPSIVDTNDSFYMTFSAGQNNTKVQYQPKPTILLQWQLNEGQGNRTTSTAGNIGNLIGNATWTNSSGFRTLLPNVDYRLDTTPSYGNVTMLNAHYNHSLIDMVLASYTTDSMYNSMTSYFSFDADNSSDAFDYSSRGINATYIGGLISNRSECIYGRCTQNDGLSAKYIDVRDSSLGQLTGNTTIMFWAKLENFNNGNTFFAKWNTTANNRAYQLGTTTNPDSSVFKLTYSRNGTSANGSNFQWQFIFPGNNVWVHVAVVQQGDTYTLYKNGERRENYTDTIFNNSIANIQLGRESSNSVLNGSMDEFMIFNVSLTQEQIGNIYRNNSQRFTQTNARNVSYVINASNRLNVSLTLLTTTTPLNSILLNITSTGNGTGPVSNASYIYISDKNYTFSLAANSTNVSLNYTLDSGNGFLTPVLGLTESVFGFMESSGGESETGNTLEACNSLVSGFATFPVLIGLIGTVLLLGFGLLLLSGFLNINGGVEFTPEMVIVSIISLIGVAVLVVIALIIFTSGALCF